MSDQNCEKCGAKLPADGGPCPNCGVSAAETKPDTAVDSPKDPEARETGESKRKPRLWAAIGAIPGRTWTVLSKLPGRTWAALKAAPGKTWTLLRKLPGKTWTVLKAAPARSWTVLLGVAAATKAAPGRITGAWTSWWGSRSRRGKIGLIAGTASAIVAVGVAVFLFFFLRPVFVVEGVETEDAIVSGEDVVLSVDVANTGRTTGDYELRALVDGEEVLSELVTLGGGAEEEVSISLSGLDVGHYDVALADWPDLVQEVWVMTPAEFEIEWIQVQPNPINITSSDEADVLVRLTNLGEATGSYGLDVSLDGEVVDSREVEIEGGHSTSETFTVTIAEPGSCEVEVNDERLEVEIYQIERPKNGEKLVSKASGGSNRLKIKNNRDEDGLIILTKSGRDEPVLVVYVRAQSTCTVRSIKSGVYDCYYSFGEGYCAYRKEFTEDQVWGQFDDPMKLSSSYRSYTVMTLSFGGGSEGGLPTGEPDPDDSVDL